MPNSTFKTCPYCMKELEEEELDAHSLSCGAGEVEYGNVCGMKMPRWMHQQHMEVNYKKRNVQSDGCSAMILFNKVEDHNAKCEEAMFCYECGKKVQKECMDVHLKEYCCKRVKKCVFCYASVVVDTLSDHYEVCELLPVQCEKRCGKKIARRYLNDHSQDCPKRLVMCQYCKIEVEFGLLETHQSDCSKSLPHCSANCGKNISREFLQQDLNEECEKPYDPCDFNKMSSIHQEYPAGMQKHMMENINHHMKRMKDMFHEHEKKVTDQLEHMENNANNYKELMQDMADKFQRNADNMEKQTQAIQAQITRMQYNLEVAICQMKHMDTFVQKVEEKLKLEVEKIETLEHADYLWTITDVHSKVKASKGKTYVRIYSPSFYITKHGYKLRLALYIREHLYGIVRFKFCIQIMSGEFDSTLKWPFTNIVTLKIIDQNSVGKDLVESCTPRQCKPKKGKYEEFCLMTILHEELLTRNYIVNDTLSLEIYVGSKFQTVKGIELNLV